MKTINDIVILHLQHRADERLRLADRAAFAAVLGVPEERLRCVDVHERAPQVSDLHGVDALVIGGSGYSVFEDVPHHAASEAVVAEAERLGIPVLGVCFGAQFLAKLHGGTVVRDTAAKEVGSFLMRRTEDGAIDAVFADLPDKFYAQCAHQDCVATVPPGAVVLAASERCAVQAFTFPGRDIYAVQFHPETTKARFLERIAASASDAPSPGVSYAEADPYDIRETPHAAALVQRFVDRVVLHRARIAERSSAATSST